MFSKFQNLPTDTAPFPHSLRTRSNNSDRRKLKLVREPITLAKL